VNRCVMCSSMKSMRKSTTKVSNGVGDRRFTAEVPADVCDACGESYVQGTTLKRFELAVARELSLSGASSGEVFKFMRKALGYRASELADELGVTPETVSRWENGRRTIDISHMALMGMLVDDQMEDHVSVQRHLAALRKPRTTPRRSVRIDLSSGNR
jgi:putative zinc finger/helix-turn-helix YgiT family protein